MASDIVFDHYFRFDELTGHLERLAAAHPDLLELGSIGTSHEGRSIPLATVTNRATGPAADKPAMLIDGNIHATEVTASAVAMFHLVILLEGYGQDPDITRCLDTRAFYIVPRLNPDGAELALADEPRLIRSSTRPYPYDEEAVSGLVMEDIDGNGRILSMRVPDSNGRWKKHPDDSRLMVRRDPIETGGEYYRIYAEGRIENYDGATVTNARPREGLDLNRNWPTNWAREHKQPGAGPFPLSEPETHALARFISEHPNVFSWIAGHTFSGVLLRAAFSHADDSLPYDDLQHYKRVGERGTELTGYPAISVFHDFRIRGDAEVHGSTEWGYDNFGLFIWAPEYWAPHRTAGCTIDNYVQWFMDHPVEDDQKMLAWSDKELDGSGFVDWQPFDHPQLGPVEIGGWGKLEPFFNPPGKLLAEVIRPFPEWFIWQLLMSPKLERRADSIERLDDDLWKLTLVIDNTGFLPTHCSARALEVNAVRGVVAEIELPEGATLVQGEHRRDLGQLSGRSGKPVVVPFGPDDTSDRARIDWVVRAPAGATCTATVRHERAGVVRHSFELA